MSKRVQWTASVACVLTFCTFAGTASAATVSCIGSSRTFTIDTAPVATCAAIAQPNGDNNLSGNGNGANPDPLFALLGPGLMLLDKTDDGADLAGTPVLSVTCTLGGSFSITDLLAPVGKEFYDIILAFKSGGSFKQASVWAAFALPDGVLTGTWSMTGKNALSHANIYGKVRDVVTPPPVPAPVPVPAAGLMLLSVMGGLGLMRRRKAA